VKVTIDVPEGMSLLLVPTDEVKTGVKTASVAVSLPTPSPIDWPGSITTSVEELPPEAFALSTEDMIAGISRPGLRTDLLRDVLRKNNCETVGDVARKITATKLASYYGMGGSMIGSVRHWLGSNGVAMRDK